MYIKKPVVYNKTRVIYATTTVTTTITTCTTTNNTSIVLLLTWDWDSWYYLKIDKSNTVKYHTQSIHLVNC